ncbi:hypothetical protein FBU30_006269 [Linnemannia zychae]|nr:hypothetical protein FBU30_006269 [Linnemannia zychae]
MVYTSRQKANTALLVMVIFWTMWLLALLGEARVTDEKDQSNLSKQSIWKYEDRSQGNSDGQKKGHQYDHSIDHNSPKRVQKGNTDIHSQDSIDMGQARMTDEKVDKKASKHSRNSVKKNREKVEHQQDSDRKDKSKNKDKNKDKDKDKNKNKNKDKDKNKNKGKDKNKNKIKDKDRDKDVRKQDESGNKYGAMATDIPCGSGLDKCPSDRPCCSQWGYCGVDADYCSEGCQEAFGLCQLDTSSPVSTPDIQPDIQPDVPDIEPIGDDIETVETHHPRKKYQRHSKTRRGFDLKAKQKQFPNYDGRQFRIPASVPKLPSSLVNIGYYPGWAQYRGKGRTSCHQRPYLPSSIPWSSLDYVMFAFVYFDDYYRLYPADASDEDLYFEINRLKMSTATRVMISIGGWSFTHPEHHHDDRSTKHRFKRMIQSSESRQVFIKSCIDFCLFYGFDGVDIDYEYPDYEDRIAVTALFREMRAAFESEASGLVLSLAGAAFQEGIQGFELGKVAAYTDFIMIMAYELYGPLESSNIVNIHTTLIQMPKENRGGHSVQGAIEMYLDYDVPRNKIVVGLALYGKTFVLTNTRNIRPGQATFKTRGDPTACIDTSGDIAYNELAPLIHPHTKDQASKVTPLWDNDAKAFYFVYGNRGDNWVGYDDRPSIDLKLQMVTEQRLAGVMWWSLDQDLDATSDNTEVSKWMKMALKKNGKKTEARPASSPHEKVSPLTLYREQEAQQAPIAIVGATDSNVDSSRVVEPMSVNEPPVLTHPEGDEHALGAVDANVTPPRAYVSQLPSSAMRPSSPAYAAVGVCSHRTPTIPPPSLSSIPLNILGLPGLVPYVALKRKHCPVAYRYPLVLPETPVGNMVAVKCTPSPGCPEMWQIYTCLEKEQAWSAPSPCYGKMNNYVVCVFPNNYKQVE